MALRILLVDDESALLQLLEKHLRRLGYEVETHEKAATALIRFESGPNNFDLVIADLGIPDMPGDALLQRMLEIRPEVPILICSGSPFYLANLPKHLVEKVAFLQKPFLPKMLAQAIEKLMAGPSAT